MRAAANWSHPTGRARPARRRPAVLRGIRNRLAFRVVPERPVRLDVLLRDDGLAVRPIEHEEVSVARRLGDELAGLAVDGRRRTRPAVCVESQSCVSCGDDWKYHTILPVSALSATIEPVKRLAPVAVLVRHDRLRIARRDIDKIELGIERDRRPRHAAAVLHRVFVRPRLGARLVHLLRNDVPAPLELARRRIVRLEVAGNVEVVAAHADDTHDSCDDRRDRSRSRTDPDRRSVCRQRSVPSLMLSETRLQSGVSK